MSTEGHSDNLSSKPLSSSRRPKFGLKELGAAAMLASAPEGHAQAQQFRTEMVELSDAQLLKFAQSALAKQEESLRVTIRGFGSDIPQSLKDEEKVVAATKIVMSTPAYLAGLRKIYEYGGNLDSFVGVLPPDTIANQNVLAEKLSHIPLSLKGQFELRPDDLRPERHSVYRIDGLEEVTALYSNAGYRLRLDWLVSAAQLEQKTPGLSKKIIEISKKIPGFKITPTDILFECAGGRLDPDSLSDPGFIRGLENFILEGYSLQELTPSSGGGRSARKKFRDRISDPAFLDATRILKDQGFNVSGSMRSAYDLKPEIYTSPLFKKNVAFLTLDPHVEHVVFVQSALVLPDLDDLVAASSAPGDDVLSFASRSIKEKDVSALTVLREYQSLFPRGSLKERFLYVLDPQRIRDKNYMRIYERWAEELQKQTDQAGDGGGANSMFEVDKLYIRSKTGSNFDIDSTSLKSYLDVLDQHANDATFQHILKPYRKSVFLRPVLEMNRQHNASGAIRLKQLEGLKAQALFEMMFSAGADAYLSTFRYIFDGNGAGSGFNTFVSAAIREKGSVYDFIQSMKPTRQDFSAFLVALSRHGYLDEFLKSITTQEQQVKILSDFLFDMKDHLTRAQMVSINNLLNASSNTALRSFVMDGFREKLSNEKKIDGDSHVLAGLLVAQQFAHNATIPDWAKSAVDTYAKYFPNITELGTEMAFREKDGVQINTQLHLFYDDRREKGDSSTWDGHNSFKNFIQSLGGTVAIDAKGRVGEIKIKRKGITVEDKDRENYVIITYADTVRNRQIVMYANKPDRSDAVVREVHSNLIKDIKPHVVVHRGHSPHAPKTISILPPEIALVNFGSCGGANEIAPTLNRAPGAQIMGTEGVGTMLINDPVLRAINAALLRTGKIHWATLRAELDAYFAKKSSVEKERWARYVLPHENQTARLIAAMNQLTEDDGSLTMVGMGNGGGGH